MGRDDFTWLAAWNGYELRAVDKSLFSGTGSHDHNSSYYTKTEVNDLIKSSIQGTLLWENTNKEVGMLATGNNANNVITLSSNNYDVLEIYYYGDGSNGNYFTRCERVSKTLNSTGFMLQVVNSYITGHRRGYISNDGKTLTFDAAARNPDNDKKRYICVPMAIYGIKY